MKATALQRQIEHLKRQLLALGPLHPGSLSEQYNVCGKAGCRCKAPRHPHKHGPYYHLSFTWRGKGYTRFVRAGRLAEVRQKIATYQRFRELTDAWVDLALQQEQQEREQGR